MTWQRQETPVARKWNNNLLLKCKQNHFNTRINGCQMMILTNKQKIVWRPMLLISLLLLIYLVIFSRVKPYFVCNTIKFSLFFSNLTIGGRFSISLHFFISILMKRRSIFIFFALPPVQLHSQRFNYSLSEQTKRKKNTRLMKLEIVGRVGTVLIELVCLAIGYSIYSIVNSCGSVYQNNCNNSYQSHLITLDIEPGLFILNINAIAWNHSYSMLNI